LRIIPVLDLKGGQVVRARQGQRHLYAPIETPLARSSGPADVAAGLRTLFRFKTFYCADLDAIEGRPPNEAAIKSLLAMPEAPSLWVDAGIADAENLLSMLAQPGINPVIGTESLPDDGLLQAFRQHSNLILSLDFFADGFRGPQGILDQADLWPATIIVMTLARVGSAAGPDTTLLGEIKARAGGRAIVAAGGIRNDGDVRRLAEMGVSAALIATSLHDGTLTATHLASLVERI
jgi:phosphoribosylformimino-5-aminoimidazole carboxamide ribotide isomerase